MVSSVAVVGAGVIGLCSARSLLEAGFEVTMYECHPRESICSSNAGAIWGPFLSQDDEQMLSWSVDTLSRLRELAARTEEAAGVEVVDGILAATYETPMPEWFALLGQDHEYSGQLPPGYVVAWRYSVPIINMPMYLAWLRNGAVLGGVTIKEKEVTDLSALLRDHLAVVNCSGMGAQELCDDSQLRPVKGQLVVVTNPGISEFFAERGDEQDLFYWMPQGDTVVIGGTAEDTYDHEEIDEVQIERMLQKARMIDRRFNSAEVLSYRVGFRPYRETIRFGVDSDIDRVIHNYGHGGSGVSLSWGCAASVVDLVRSVSPQ